MSGNVRPNGIAIGRHPEVVDFTPLRGGFSLFVRSHTADIEPSGKRSFLWE
jgi:hypothetical protein